MLLWKDDSEGTTAPARAGHEIPIAFGTHPIEPDQRVVVRYRVAGTERYFAKDATWVENRSSNSYWRANIGPFEKGDHVEFTVEAQSPASVAETISGEFEVLPRLWLALLWHQHQPLYRDTSLSPSAGAYMKPWVRLHALRDYYAMAAIVAEHPAVRLTINLTPVLLEQLDEYARAGATDRALDLTLKPIEVLSPAEREELFATFFDADWHHQIFVHARYRELFAMRSARQSFTDQDARDLQMWFNLAWFGKEFREREVLLATGEVASVKRFVDKGRDFSPSEIFEMVAEQRKILRAVIPLHRALQDRGQIEVSTTPYYHPILPLLVDTDRATIDRPGTTFPERFSHPEDARAQVHLAVEAYASLFGRPPRGMWPAEGAVATFALPFLEQEGVRWIATDQGVLARSGRWGYEAHRAEVLCRVYRAEEPQRLALFFRATEPSNEIGFHFQHAEDQERAARSFVALLKNHFGSGPRDDDRVLTLALDGENAWGAYPDDGRPFLHALYRALTEDPDVQTTTFSGYLKHRTAAQATERIVHELFTGSWIDEMGSAPGVDLGTWIGETEENRAWVLLGRVRDALSEAALDIPPAALAALYAAEGSDWFWWFGEDQDSGTDQEFDDLFRMHLRNALRLAAREPLSELDLSIVPHAVVWSFSNQIGVVSAGDRLVVRTNCPGELEWWYDGEHSTGPVDPVGGVMAGVSRYERMLGPFRVERELVFRFICGNEGCIGESPCCHPTAHRVRIMLPRAS
jgi:alpha-amylase/alpha-mannosidase (GH57 family)